MWQESVRIGADTWFVGYSRRNHETMLPKLSKFVDLDLAGNEPLNIKTKGKTTSQSQVNHNPTSTIMVGSLN